MHSREQSLGRVTIIGFALVTVAGLNLIAIVDEPTGRLSIVALTLVAIAVALVPLGTLDSYLLARAFACGCALVSSWNALALGPIQLVDLTLPIALALTAMAAPLLRDLRCHWSILLLVGSVAVVVVVAQLVPIASSFDAARFVIRTPDSIYASSDRASGNVLNGFRWLVALVGVPLLFAVAELVGRGLATEIVRAWAWGAVVSALVALADATGATAISAALIPVADIGGRQAGLTNAPNSLAVTSAMAIPLLLYGALSARRGTHVFVHSLGAMVVFGGIVASGSRGGFIGALIAIAATLILVPQARSKIATLLAASSLAMLTLVLASPGLWKALLEAVRLSDESSAGESDAGRELLREQAFRDFSSRPFTGVGLEVVTEAHSIFLQLIAAGGLLLALAFAATILSALHASWEARALAGWLIPSARACASWMAMGVLENQLTDRFLYFPLAYILGAAVYVGNRCKDDQLSLNRVEATPRGKGMVTL